MSEYRLFGRRTTYQHTNSKSAPCYRAVVPVLLVDLAHFLTICESKFYLSAETLDLMPMTEIELLLAPSRRLERVGVNDPPIKFTP